MTAVQPALAPAQIGQIRDELVRALSRLERSLKISDGAPRPGDLEQDTVGRLSRIDALQNQGLMQSLAERERAQLAAIVEALHRIEDGTFGACSACGRTIPFERLQVFPEAKACAACATG